ERLDLPADAPHPGEQLLLLADRMRHRVGGYPIGAARSRRPLQAVSCRRTRFPAFAGDDESSLHPHGQMVILGEVGEARELALEVELHGAGRTVTLLADDDLGLAVRRVHL